jgi:hypothetical protein
MDGGHPFFRAHYSAMSAAFFPLIVNECRYKWHKRDAGWVGKYWIYMERIEPDMHEIRSERRVFQNRCSVEVAITISTAPRNRTNSFWNLNSALSFVQSL